MRCKCKVLSVAGIPASDGSIVPIEVMESYLRSDACQEALRMHKMIGSLTHRARAIKSNFAETGSELSKVIGKDDSLISMLPGAPCPTHYVDKLYIEDGWLWAEIELLDPSVMDDAAAQSIKRFSGMLKNGILPGVSAVIVGFWSSDNGSKSDVLKKLVNFKGIDVTLNSSWKDASVTEVLEDGASAEKEFSEVLIENLNPDDYKFTGVKAKMFSDVNSIYSGPKSSKIDGKFCSLKAKVFSANGVVEEIGVIENLEEQKEFTQPDEVEEQKEFTQAQVRERLRESKLGVRMELRRTILSYRQVVKQMGGSAKIDPDDLKTLKSLLSSDLLRILNAVTPQIMEGKQINTLLGLSSLGKAYREYGQKLNMPMRLSLQELKRNGFVNKARYQKLQAAYVDFINAVLDDVFGPNPSPIVNEDENLEENEGEE